MVAAKPIADDSGVRFVIYDNLTGQPVSKPYKRS